MTALYHNPLLVIFVLYFTLLLLVGGVGYRATHNISDYLLGGRHLGRFVTALAAGASDMSGWLLMGLPGAIYTMGLSQAWIAVGLIIGAWLNWTLVAGRLRLYTEEASNSLTLPDYLAHRFGNHSHTLRLVTGFVILMFFSLYCASGMVAGARLFETVLNIPYITALWICGLITIGYVFLGGFLAVSWTDTLQALLMMGALLGIPLIVMGGSASTMMSLSWGSDQCGDKLNGVPIVSLLAWGLGYFGQPHILVRFMAAKSIRVLPSARRISIGWMTMCLIGAIAIGMCGPAYFAVHPGLLANKVNADPELVLIGLSQELLHPWLSGLVLAAVFSAIMSTLSSQLLVCASALTQDIYQVFSKKPVTGGVLVALGRFSVLLVTVIAGILAATSGSQILEMVSYAWAGLGAALGPVILLSLFWSRITEKAALLGVVSGALTVFIWKQHNPWGLYEIVPGFIIASVVIVCTSLLDKAPSEHVVQKFRKVSVVFRLSKK